MMSADLLGVMLKWVIDFFNAHLYTVMFTAYFFSVVLRVLVHYTLTRSEWYVREFEKRVNHYVDGLDVKQDLSFFPTVKRLMEFTFYESFVLREMLKRRKPDTVMSIADRVFLVQSGAAFIIKDTLKQIMFLRRDGNQPKFLEISNNVMRTNPCFTKVFGIFPGATINEGLNLMPGMFIVAGIFGTFIGIMQGLPALSTMNIEDVHATKVVMDKFLIDISFSMATSIVGIILSVTLSFFNAFLSPEKLFVSIVERFENILDLLWNRCTSNDVSAMPDLKFDENKNPLVALAENSIRETLEKSKFYKKRYQTRTPDYRGDTARDVAQAYAFVKAEDKVPATGAMPSHASAPEVPGVPSIPLPPGAKKDSSKAA